MKWLQLSDIHFSLCTEGVDSLLLRKQLINYLQNEIGKVDWIFLLGDFRYRGNPKKPDRVLEWIRQIAEAVGIYNLSERVCMVPGNHDIDRNPTVRQFIIDGVKKNYNVLQGKFDEMTLKALLGSFSYYNSLYKKIYNKDYIGAAVNTQNPHLFKDCGEFYLLMLNTVIISNEDNERGSLLVGSSYVVELLTKVTKPIFVLAHHGLHMLEKEEGRKLKQIFKEWGIELYLCGDEHVLYEEMVGSQIYQITSGCLYGGSKETDIAFMTGEIIGDGIRISAYEWKSNWTKALHFGEQGTLYIQKQKGTPDPTEKLEPKLKEHIVKGIEEYKQKDIPIHTSQILILLLTYSGSVLRQVLNEYRNIHGMPYGKYLYDLFKEEDRIYKEQNFHFNYGYDLNELFNMREAISIQNQKRTVYITENILSYAVLCKDNSITVQNLQKVFGKENFQALKNRILQNPTLQEVFQIAQKRKENEG